MAYEHDAEGWDLLCYQCGTSTQIPPGYSATLWAQQHQHVPVFGRSHQGRMAIFKECKSHKSP